MTVKNKIGIIGGGPAGLTAAINGAELGMEVILWEKDNIGENINCAEGYFDSLKQLGPPVAGIKYKVKKIIVEIEKEYILDTDDINLWMIDRKKWQQELAQRARDKGVIIKENTRIRTDDLEELKKEFEWILDGSGIPSVSSHYYNFRNTIRDRGLVAVQYHIKGGFSNFNQTIKGVILKGDFGYGWIFPKSKSLANVGLGIFLGLEQKIKGVELYNKLDKFILEQELEGEIKGKTAGLCPNNIPETLVKENVVLMGDAAGLTSPLHGGGIDLACISASLAIKAIWEGKASNYSDYLKQKIGKKLKFERYLRRLWLRKGREDLDNMVKKVFRLMGNRFGGALIRQFTENIL